MTEQAVKISIIIKIGKREKEITKSVRAEELEAEIRSEVQKMGKLIMEESLQELDERLWEGVKAKWKNLGREGRWWLTSVGKVEVKRRVYRDEEEERRKPLDELVGIRKHERSSDIVRGMGAYLGSELGYRGAAGQLSWMIGEKISKDQIQRAVWGVGNEIADREAQEREAVFSSGAGIDRGKLEVETLYGESDGVWVALQREAKRRQEVRVGILYGGKKAIGQGRFRLSHKCCVTGVVANSQEWQEYLLKAAHQYYDLEKTKQMIVGGDGNGWVWNSFERFMIPHEHVLDRYHLVWAARTAFGSWEKAKPIVNGLRKFGYDDMKDTLESCLLLAEGKRRNEIGKFVGYVSRLAEGVQDLSHRTHSPLDLSQVCSLGAIEGNVDKLVVHRMKGRGCSWRLPGVRG